MKELLKFALISALALGAITGCKDKDDPEPPIANIEVENKTALTQTAFADNTAGASDITFTTAGAWISTINEGNAKAVSWINISPDRGNAAGKYTIAITLTPNTTGADRTATIIITCNGEDIKITVTQKSTTQEGKPLDPGNNEEEEPLSSAITMTTNKAWIRVALRGTGLATVHWPDGDQTKMLDDSPSNDTTNFIRNFGTAQNRTITITGDNITYLYCAESELLTLDVGNNTALTELKCAYNKLTILDVSKLTALEYLDCGDNQLASLDVSKNTALISLVCNRNLFTSLDVNGLIALKYLAVGGEQLTSLDVSKLTTLRALSVEGFTSLDVSKLTTLEELSIFGCTFTSLDVSKNTALKDLRFYDNSELTSVDASGLTALEQLVVRFNDKLTTLNLSGCTSFRYIDASSNQLTSLDVSGCTALSYLDIFGEQLTSLNISGCANLYNLDCRYNQFTTDGLNALFGMLPNRSSGNSGSIAIGNNPGTNTCSQSIATSKNWNFVTY